MDYTILVTSYNDEKNFKKILDAIESQTLRPYEIIIADGGSSDKSYEMISSLRSRYSYPIRYIASIQRLNIPQGYNVAIEQCKTELMIIMGIGNNYGSGFCESLVKYYNTHDVDIVYTPIVGINQNCFSRAFNIAFVGGNKGKDFGMASNRGVLISKKVFDKTGLFYEGFVYAGEDSEYFERADKMGFQSGCNTECNVFWETPISFEEYLKKSRVNAIADMQCQSNKSIVKHIVSRVLLSAFLVLLAITRWYLCVVAIAALSGLIAFKIKSANLLALLLRLHFIFLPDYYYIKNYKYFDQQYKIQL